jgi:chloramphenicol 3-O-phosphotransferase
MVTGGNDPPGRVVILNGGSSAGKTTLGRSLQAALSDTWVLLGIDLLIWMMPPRMINDADGLSVHEGVIVRGGSVHVALWRIPECGGHPRPQWRQCAARRSHT